GGVHATVDASGEVPQHPGVGRAEHQVAGIRLLPCTGDVLEDPRDLRAGEVRRQRQADYGGEAVDAAVGGEAVDDLLGAGVLPDDRVVHRVAGAAVPDHRGLALVGDAHRGDVMAGEVGTGQSQTYDLLHVAPDLRRVVLDPPGA